MKKITIGRGRECDIRLSDNTDKVSRRQAVITVSPTGKMMIYDTSANGTYVNGEKVEKPAGKPIKRGDNINFAHLVDLDWEKVKNPYRKIWTMSSLFIVVVLIVAAVLFIWGDAIFQEGKAESQETLTEQPVEVVPADPDLVLETPQETQTPVMPKAQQPKSGNKTKDGVSPKDESKADEPEHTQEITLPEQNDPNLDNLINQK